MEIGRVRIWLILFLFGEEEEEEEEEGDDMNRTTEW